MIGNRVGLIVWLQHLKYSRQLRKYGNVYYISKKMRYAVLYCDESNYLTILSKLKALHFVKDIQVSQLKDIKTVYSKKKSPQEKQKEEITL